MARTLVKIPASALSGIKASQITSAKLYYRDLMCEGDAVRIDCYPLTANWTESTVKCNAAIWTATGSLLSYQTVKSGNGEDGVGGPSGGHWYGFDITTAAKTWINTGNYYGVMLCANAESGAAKTFASANRSSYQPQLVVDYNADHVAVSQVCLSATSLTMRVGSTANLTATIVPSNATKKGITWETTDGSIVGVGETGLLCAKNVGTVTITARAEDNTSIKASCLVTVQDNVPSKFADLRTKGLITTNDIRQTTDNFYICTQSLAHILNSAKISTLYDTVNTSKQPSVYSYYDDWYLFAVPAGSTYTYGLYKMREQEHDGEGGNADGDDPGVTISFVQLNTNILFNCLNTKSRESCLALNSEIDRVVQTPKEDYDSDIQVYFSNPASEGAYLIAETYTKFIASTAVNGNIPASDQYLSLLESIEEINSYLENPYITATAKTVLLEQKQKLMRIPNGLAENNEKAGYTVSSSNQIYIKSPLSPSSYEQYAILMMCTANVTYNSFAAEVKFHSDALIDPKANLDDWYNAAVRADMVLGEDVESGLFEQYYDLESDMVQEQIRYHGEC